jgi:hypothetical protein
MKIIIITDDSGVKLPVFNKWKKTYGKGVDISKNSEIISLLNSKNCDIPSNDLTKESIYRVILKQYIRPAKLMFAGMFREVLIFADKLSNKFPTELFIISGRYGLIDENFKIIPYHFHIDSQEKLLELDNRTKLLFKIQKIIQNDVICILLLPKHYLQFLLLNKLFENITKNSILILVSTDEYKEYSKKDDKIIFLHRIGVARIGKENQRKIFAILEKIKT